MAHNAVAARRLLGQAGGEINRNLAAKSTIGTGRINWDRQEPGLPGLHSLRRRHSKQSHVRLGCTSDPGVFLQLGGPACMHRSASNCLIQQNRWQVDHQSLFPHAADHGCCSTRTLCANSQIPCSQQEQVKGTDSVLRLLWYTPARVQITFHCTGKQTHAKASSAHQQACSVHSLPQVHFPPIHSHAHLAFWYAQGMACCLKA